MGVEVSDSNLGGTEVSTDDIFYASNRADDDATVDARRRLEDRIDDLRLQRELRDFDFDI